MKQQAYTGPASDVDKSHDKSASQWMDFDEAMELALKEQRGRFMALAVPFVLAPLVAMVVVALAFFNLSNQHSQETLESQQKQRSLEELKSETGKLREGMQKLMTGKLPGVIEFKFDESVDVNKKYLKALAFHESASTDGQVDGYQVRTTFFNQSNAKVFPELKISFFDQDGYVTGYFHISPTPGSNAALTPLQPNQKRSDLSEVVKLPGGVMPSYFIVDVE
jgi:hypothetical protein